MQFRLGSHELPAEEGRIARHQLPRHLLRGTHSVTVKGSLTHGLLVMSIMRKIKVHQRHIY